MISSLKNKNFIVHIPIILGAIVMLYPLIWLLSGSFKLPQEIFANSSLWPKNFTLENYTIGWKGVSGLSFGTFFKNSFVISGLSIIGNIISCSMAAYAFARLQFKFKNIFFALMLVSIMIPYHVIIIPQYIFFNKLDWINTFLPLVVPKFLATDGFFIFLLVQFIRGLPRELDEAATMDGCGPIRIYWKIILPLLLPAIATTAIFTFIWTWNDFFSQLIYLTDPRNFTVSLGLRLFLDSMGQSQWGPMFSMSILSLVPVFVMFLVFQRYIIEGITSGGIKG